MSSKPNILFLLSDQHNPRVAGYAGDRHVRTPNLDRLAAGGTQLSRCYCASPLCVPSRMALLSGRYPDATGVFTNDQSLSSDVPTVAHALAIAGYETVLCGRMHFVGPDQRHGFTRRILGDFTTTLLGAPNANCGQAWAGTTGQHRQVIERSGAGNSGVMDYDRDVSAAAIAYLRHAPADRPWFMTVGWYGPHCPYCCPPDLFDRYMRTLPPPDCPAGFKASCHPAMHRWMERRDILEVSEEAVRRARAAYYGLVEVTDRHVGAVLDTLASEGLAENTLVVYASDHGDCLGHNGFWWKSNFYEGSARVPCLWSQPGMVTAGRDIAEVTSLLDVGPTFIDYAGASPLPRPDGVSLTAILRGAPAPSNRAVLSMLGGLKDDAPSAMIRRGPWKLVAHVGHTDPQLFNLDKDPAEQHDLGADPACEAVRRDLLSELRKRWDGEAVRRAREDSRQDTRVIRQWTAIAPPTDSQEFWSCSPDRNFRA